MSLWLRFNKYFCRLIHAVFSISGNAMEAGGIDKRRNHSNRHFLEMIVPDKLFWIETRMIEHQIHQRKAVLIIPDSGSGNPDHR